MGNSTEVRVPDLGGSSHVPVIELLVAVGDRVAVDQGLVTLESDKATMEIPSPVAGIVRALKPRIGDLLSEQDIIALVDVSDPVDDVPAPVNETTREAATFRAPHEATPAPDTPTPPSHTASPPPAPSQDLHAASSAAISHASPAVRQMARELGVDVTLIAGSGRSGRIMRGDVSAYVKQALSGDTGRHANSIDTAQAGGLNLLPWPSVDFTRFGQVQEQPFTRIQKLSANHLARNWVHIPHVTQHDQADVTELETLRVQLNRELAGEHIRVTMLAFLIKASAALLKAFPRFNASLDETGQTLVVKKYYHVGFAVDTPQGLVVPVVRDVDQKGIRDIAQETALLASKARDGELTPVDMQGGSFSISSLGGIGGTAFTPIINAPEVAILGVSRASIQPVWDGQGFQPRLLLPLSLSYDHRVIDGALAARFTADLARLLGDFRRALL